MLNGIYIFNFRNLVNFELRPGALSLLIGPNGFGKLAVLDLLARLRAFVVDGASVDAVFPDAGFSRPAAGDEIRQVLELDLETNGGCYRYRLVVRLLSTTGQVRMEEERLRFQDHELFRFTIQDGHAKALRERLPGFVALALVRSGERKMLKARFRLPGSTEEVQFSLRELSDGQRALIAPQTLLPCLPEIQPWLDRIYEQVEDERLLALLVSHHPRLINMIAEDSGFWVHQDDDTGVARVSPIMRGEDSDGLPLSQLVERGWIVDA